MFTPKRNTGSNALRRGRLSVPHANYFVTVNLDARRPALLPAPAEACLAAARQLDAEQVWRLRCLTVMPDHTHLFFTLGTRLSLSGALARFKHETKKSLAAVSARWQENFYDHRMRANESAEPVIRYLWLNPYRAGLLRAGEAWPCFYCCAEDWAWFVGLTDGGTPEPGWLR